MHYALSLSHVLASHWQGFYMEYIVHSQMPQIKKSGLASLAGFLIVLKLKMGPHLGIPSFLDRRLFCPVCLSVCLSACLALSVSLHACLSLPVTVCP